MDSDNTQTATLPGKTSSHRGRVIDGAIRLKDEDETFIRQKDGHSREAMPVPFLYARPVRVYF